MKKILAFAIAIIMMSTLCLGATVLAAAPPADTPPELTTAFYIGVWPLAAGSYDPGLDGNSILNGTRIYGLFGGDYAPLPAPTSVTGYTAVSSATAVTAGTYYVLNTSSGFAYVLLGDAGTGAPSAPSATDVPPELASAFPVGTWPLPAGSYDPALDGNSIPNGARIFGLFDAAYAPQAVPSAVTGYTQVSSLSSLVDGTYYVLNGSSGFSYVILSAGSGNSDGTPVKVPFKMPTWVWVVLAVVVVLAIIVAMNISAKRITAKDAAKSSPKTDD
ncbi:MAG: hypothetical protein LBN02_03535 [Oscillospiraceae bacterium]|jgi:hypothetical protein|nr:hypothetical protein [Oscillospiraceae bacterium]